MTDIMDPEKCFESSCKGKANTIWLINPEDHTEFWIIYGVLGDMERLKVVMKEKWLTKGGNYYMEFDEQEYHDKRTKKSHI